jgi:hypothetical protein
MSEHPCLDLVRAAVSVTNGRKDVFDTALANDQGLPAVEVTAGDRLRGQGEAAGETEIGVAQLVVLQPEYEHGCDLLVDALTTDCCDGYGSVSQFVGAARECFVPADVFEVAR